MNGPCLSSELGSKASFMVRPVDVEELLDVELEVALLVVVDVALVSAVEAACQPCDAELEPP